MSCRSGYKKNNNKISSVEEQQALLECFSPEHSDLVNLGQDLGVSALNRFLETFGGTKPHISKKEIFWKKLWTACRDEKVKAKFNGVNHEELRIEFQLSVRQIYRIVNGN